MPEERYGSPAASADSGEGGVRWRRNIAFLVFAGAAAYFLLTEHRAHTIRALPWIILLLCPLMHVFMHRGHGGHDGEADAHDARGHESHGGPR